MRGGGCGGRDAGVCGGMRDAGRGLWGKGCREGTGKRDVGRGLWKKGCREGDESDVSICLLSPGHQPSKLGTV